MVEQACQLVPELQTIPLDFALSAIEKFMATEDARQATAEGLRISYIDA